MPHQCIRSFESSEIIKKTQPFLQTTMQLHIYRIVIIFYIKEISRELNVTVKHFYRIVMAVFKLVTQQKYDFFH